jgi:single-stranded-DNA-specific exonuclease
MHITIRQPQAHIQALQTASAVLDRIYRARGVTSLEELDNRLQSLLPFSDLLGIEKACVRLEKALRETQRILVIGDFDADGATSSALAVCALRAMGAQHVEFLVPNRFEYGYGLTPPIVDVAKRWSPDLIITVDNGISSVEGVNHANQLGIDVVITDHHLPGEILPKAAATVNPNQVGCAFKSKSIAGVGVIFYVMLALRRTLVQSGWFETQGIAEPNMALYLDLVALGTVADVVGLDQNNRILVQQGLMRIRQGLSRPGIQALIEVSGKTASQLKASDLGFSVAPRLNAAGRLDDMSLGINCLLSNSLAQARHYAKQLDELNLERRKIETEMKSQAMQDIDKLALQEETSNTPIPIALCLFDPSWHQGVIGILAGRLKEKYHRPVVAFAQGSEDEIKGSLRSIPGLNIRDVLATIDKDHPGLISKFGGHAMAAGMTLNRDAFSVFRDAFVHEVAKHVDPTSCRDVILSDGLLATSELNLALAQLIQESGPWGQQFPEPIFDNHFEIIDQRLVGQHHLMLTLMHSDGGECIDAIAFQVDLKKWPNHRARYIHAAYRLDINTFNARTKLQLVIVGMKVVEPESL